jgi:glyoxylase-like metal-dependent hydrolase (beta-lactamase superfamily II)
VDRWTNVGAAELLVLEDGLCSYEPGFLLARFRGVPLEELPDDIRARLHEDGYLYLPYHPTLIRAGETTVLVDFGAGAEAAREWEEDVGHASDALSTAAIGRDEIHVAVITHAHPDHLGAFTEVVDDVRVPTFPDVRHLISVKEWRFWVEGDPGGLSAEMVPMARRDLTILRDAGVLELVEGDEEIADGVRLLPTPGHTPGHVSVLVSSGDQTAVVGGDVAVSEWSFSHPEWFGPAEVEPELVPGTRRALYDLLIERDGLLFGFHLEGPGRVTRAGDAYAFEPL